MRRSQWLFVRVLKLEVRCIASAASPGRMRPALNRRDDLNATVRVGHRHGCMPHTCQVGDRVRSNRGLGLKHLFGQQAMGEKKRAQGRRASRQKSIAAPAWCHRSQRREGKMAQEGYFRLSSAHTASVDHSFATASKLSLMDGLVACAARSLASLASPR